MSRHGSIPSVALESRISVDRRKFNRSSSYRPKLSDPLLSSRDSWGTPDAATSSTSSTPSNRPPSEQRSLELAAALTNAAFKGRPLEVLERPKWHRWVSSLRPLRMVVMGLYLGIGLIERPMWCFHDSCGDPTITLRNQYHLSNHVSLTLELACLVFLSLDTVLRMGATGIKAFVHSRAHRLELALLTLCILDVLLSYFVQLIPHFRLSPFLRPILFVTKARSFRAIFKRIGYTVVAMATPLFALVFFLFFSSFAAILIFGPLDGDERVDTKFFTTYLTALQNLQILLTTANFPDVMMPAYANSDFSPIFFFVFLMFGMWFLMPVLLASIVESYQSPSEERSREKEHLQAEMLSRAFSLIATPSTTQSERGIPNEVCISLLIEMSKYKYVQLPAAQCRAVVQGLDEEKTGFVSESAFRNLFQALQQAYEEEKIRKGSERTTTWIQRRYPDVDFRKFLHSKRLKVAIFTMLALDLAFTIATYESLNVRQSCVAGCVQLVVTLVYLSETLFAWGVLGSKRFWYSWRRRIALFTTLLSILAEAANMGGVTNDGGGCIIANRLYLRYVLLCRLIRCSRIVVFWPNIRSLAGTLGTVGPHIATLLAGMVSFCFFYAQLGILFFGGIIRRDNPLLLNTAFHENDYYKNNFNDFPSALVMLFELSVVNNWYVLMEGVAAAADTQYARFYFLLWYFLGVLVCLNLVVATVLDGYRVSAEKRLAKMRTIAKLRNEDSVVRYNSISSPERTH